MVRLFLVINYILAKLSVKIIDKLLCVLVVKRFYKLVQFIYLKILIISLFLG